MSDRQTKFWIQSSVFVVVLVWCGVHTYGLWRHDPRQALILVVSTSIFFAIWSCALFARRMSLRRSHEAPHTGRWNATCLAAFALAVSGSAIAFYARFYLITPPQALHSLLGTTIWVSVGILGTATLTAMIGLSSPTAKRGKTFGIAALMIVALMVLASLLLPLAMPIS